MPPPARHQPSKDQVKPLLGMCLSLNMWPSSPPPRICSSPSCILDSHTAATRVTEVLCGQTSRFSLFFCRLDFWLQDCRNEMSFTRPVLHDECQIIYEDDTRSGQVLDEMHKVIIFFSDPTSTKSLIKAQTSLECTSNETWCWPLAELVTPHVMVAPHMVIVIGFRAQWKYSFWQLFAIRPTSVQLAVW